MTGDGRARNAVRDRLRDQFVEALAETLLRRRCRLRIATVEDNRAAAAAEIEPAFVREDAIGLGDRVVMDAEIDRELAHGRKLFSWRKLAGDEQGPEAADDLLVDGPRGGQVNTKGARVRHCLLYTYNIQLTYPLSSKFPANDARGHA